MPPRSPRRHRDSRLPPGTRRIAHIDIDSFLASVEIAMCPELAGKPVIVGGPPTSRNLVMSCTYEARSFGIWPGMALSLAQRLCPHAVFRDGDSQAANRLRDEVTRVLLDFTPRVEVTSIDDFYLDLTGSVRLFGAACDACALIRQEIRERARLPASIGIASNRLMARLAGKLAKPGGIAELLPGYEETFLTGLPVEHLPGVGHSIGSRLKRFSIRTVGELRLVPREVLFASFGRNGLVLHARARGLDDTRVETSHFEDQAGRLVARPPRSIQREATFEPEEGRREIIESMLSYLVERAADRLRSFRLAAKSIEVRIVYVDTRPHDQRTPSSPSSKRRSFPYPTDSTDEIWRRARASLHELPRRRSLVKRIGLTLHNIQAASGWQGRLFADGDALPRDGRTGSDNKRSHADRQRRIDQALDHLRKEVGFGSILRGASTPLSATHPLDKDGYRLRTPSLNQ